MNKVLINTYRFKELPENIQDKIINKTITFYLECIQFENLSKEMQQAINKANEMQTPWFTGSYIWEYAKKEVLKECDAFNYLINGDVINERILNEPINK